MKKTLPTLGVLLASVFYVAWPAYSGYQIRDALETNDEAKLSGKVDFPSVRAALKPIVAARLETELDKALKKAGPLGGLLGGDLKTKALGTVTESILNAMVTPKMLIRVHEQGGNFKEALDKLIQERAQQANALGSLFKGNEAGDAVGAAPGETLPFGGDGASAATDVQTVAGAPRKRKFDINNLKGAGLDGPLGVHLSVAKNPSATEPDITVRFQFIDNDWKLTAIEPRL